jgi:hypothetical protein
MMTDPSQPSDKKLPSFTSPEKSGGPRIAWGSRAVSLIVPIPGGYATPLSAKGFLALRQHHGAPRAVLKLARPALLSHRRR